MKEKINYLNKSSGNFLYNFQKESLLQDTYETFNSADKAAEFFGNKISSKSTKDSKEYGAGINEVKLFNADGTKMSGKVYLLGKIVEGQERSISPLEVAATRDSPFILNALAPEDQGHITGVQTTYLPGRTIAITHTHGQGSLNFSEKEPGIDGNEGDKAMAEQYKVNVYLVNKAGQLKLFDYITKNEKRILNNLPGSTNKPMIDQNGKPIDYTKEKK